MLGFFGPCKRQSSMLHCIQNFTNTWDVTKQAKRHIHVGKTIYYEYICLCWVSTLFGMICYFSNCSESSNKRLRSLFYLCCKWATFLCARTHRNEMKRIIEICILWGQRKHLWIVFSFKQNGLSCLIILENEIKSDGLWDKFLDITKMYSIQAKIGRTF